MAQKDKTEKIIVIDHPRMITGCIGLALGLAVLVLSLLKKSHQNTQSSFWLLR